MPNNFLYEMNTSNITVASRKKPMNIKRFGHISIYIKGSIYVIGGFYHKD
jgi:hypothetical protein